MPRYVQGVQSLLSGSCYKPELDDDFEPVYRFETASVDPRVLNKLLSLRMSSVDGPAQTNVQINNSTSVQTALPAKPKLVQPNGAVRKTVVTKTASDRGEGMKLFDPHAALAKIANQAHTC